MNRNIFKLVSKKAIYTTNCIEYCSEVEVKYTECLDASRYAGYFHNIDPTISVANKKPMIFQLGFITFVTKEDVEILLYDLKPTKYTDSTTKVQYSHC